MSKFSGRAILCNNEWVNIEERNALVMRFYPLCWQIATRLYRRTDIRRIGDREDVAQEAVVALIRAVERYNPDFRTEDGKPVKLLTFAHRSISLRLNTIARNHGLIRVPVGVQQKMGEQDRAEREDQEWADRIEKAKVALGIQQMPVDPLTGQEQDVTLCYDADPFLFEDVQNTLRFLDKESQWAVAGFFGLTPLGKLTLDEMGQEKGLSRERVRQLKDRGVKRLRKRLGTA